VLKRSREDTPMAATLAEKNTRQLDNPGLSVPEAAAYAGVALQTMRNRISLGKGPKVQRIGRRVVIRLIDLEAWIASQPEPVKRQRATV
jgi:predicted DNA-binding transcriptional regulator AlpA